MSPSFLDRIISIISYFTFGFFSLIWIIYANLTKKRMGDFLNFNLYQAIFLSIALAVISLIYQIAINFMVEIPFLSNYAKAFHIFFNQSPIYYTFTLSGLIITLFLTYLSIICLFGRKPYIPFVSDIIKVNLGG